MTSKVGHQFATPVDWVEGRQRLFKDAVKTARDFEPAVKGGAPVPLDANGWPLSDAKCVIFTEGGPGANGKYLARFKPVNPASAKLIGTGGSPADFSPPVIGQDGYVSQEITVRATAAQTPQLHVIVQGTGGGFTDLAILRPGFADFADADAFNPEPLRVLKELLGCGLLRLMGLLKTNASPVVEYGDFTEPTDIFWRANDDDPDDRGCPYEICLELASRVDCDVLVNIPHMASDDCVRTMAEKALASIPRNRRAVLEYSNETWNEAGSFTQSFYCQQRGAAALAAGDTRFSATDKRVRGHQWATLRSCQCFRIWQQVWGPESYRLRHIIAGQASFPDVLNVRRAWLKEQENDATMADVWGYAITGYFGSDPVYTNRADFVAEDLFKTGYQIGAVSYPGIYLDDRSKLWSFVKYQQFLAACKEDGKTSNVYEGGLSLGESDVPGVPDAVKKAVRAEKAKAQEDPRLQQYVDQGVRGFFTESAKAGVESGYFAYFLLCNKWGTDVYGLTDDVSRVDVPKIKAIGQLASEFSMAPADPTAYLLGRIAALEKENLELRTTVSALQADVQKLTQACAAAEAILHNVTI